METRPTITSENVEEVISHAGRPGGLSLEQYLELTPEEVDIMWEALMGEC